MNTYCQIVDNKVHWIFEAEEVPEFESYITIKDITNVNPQPKEGWNYDVSKDTYSSPIVQEIQPTLEDKINYIYYKDMGVI